MKDLNTYTVNVKCTACGRIHPFRLHALIDPAKDPEAENKIFSSEYFEAVCPYCHNVTPTSYACMYHDGSKNLLIGFAEEDEDYRNMKKSLMDRQTATALDAAITQWLDRCKIRIVRSEYELQEKVLIEHFHLDDRVIELVRYEMFKNISQMRKGVRKLLFNVQDGNYVFILATDSGMKEMVALDTETYDAVKEKYMDVLKDEDVYEVNEEWAKAQYKEDDVIV